jgi:hypothetical protein
VEQPGPFVVWTAGVAELFAPDGEQPTRVVNRLARVRLSSAVSVLTTCRSPDFPAITQSTSRRASVVTAWPRTDQSQTCSLNRTVNTDQAATGSGASAPVAELFTRVANRLARMIPDSAVNLFDHLSSTTIHDTPAAGAVDFNPGKLAELGSKPTFVRGDKSECICHCESSKNRLRLTLSKFVVRNW